MADGDRTILSDLDGPLKEELPGSPNGMPAKKKQKRNKPTLSCEECVERKTKCDRGRPSCVACVKRQSECKYSDIANLIASADHGATRRPRTQSKSVLGDEDGHTRPNHEALPIQIQILTPPAHSRGVSSSSTLSSPFLLSNIPHSNHNPAPFFGLASEHPFANYWTSRGGLPEVIGVLPVKDQADILVAKYFEAVDPLYPMIHRRNFYADYERFWSLPTEEKQHADPVLVGLHFVVYAMGTQFISTSTDHQRTQIAEFYVSASQQALRLSSYLSRASVRTLQAMVLICYFLMNDNHASDAWSFGGVLARQAYAMGLHRDPDIITPRCSQSDKHQRRKLWQAIYFQDTFLTVLLKLPPTTTFSDVRVESLTDELDDYMPNNTSINGTLDTILNPMSISNIVPDSDAFPPYELSDRQYIRSMWHMANLVQRTICFPRSLNHPLCSSTADKEKLITQYHDLLSSFPSPLTTSDQSEIVNLANTNLRQLRQNLSLRTNFWHCLMVIYSDENNAGRVMCDVKGALHAARMALEAFFQLREFLSVDAGVWWVFQHRAFEEALLMARILGQQDQPLSPSEQGMSPSSDPLLVMAKEDARKTLDILEQVGSAPEMQKTRTEVLRTAFAEISW